MVNAMAALDPDKRTRILDAAAELFAKFGFKKASIDEIASKAGVGKGTVYLMCESKEDLFYQVVHRELRQWVAQVSEHLDPRLPADQLLVMCQVVSMQYAQSRPLVAELFMGNLEEMLPLWASELDDLRAVARRRNLEILEIGVKQGIFRQDLDLPAVGKLLQDLHAMSILLVHREKRPLDEQAQMAMLGLDLLLNGMRPR